MKKLAVVVTHPIQYYVPVFQLLAIKCELKVFYTWGVDGAKLKYDPDFKQIMIWDIPLLEGYSYEFLSNVAKNPGSHHFGGIVNPDLQEIVSSFSPDVILIYGWAYKSHLNTLRYFKGKIPVLFRGDSTLLNERKGVKQLLRFIVLKWVYKNTDSALYVGSANKAYFKKFGIKEHQLIFVPHAVDNERFSEERAEEVSFLRKNLGIGAQETLILFAGKLERKKNPELLLQAFAELKMDKVHLLFVGNGELEEDLKLKVKSLRLRAGGIKPNIYFMDFQNQSYMPVVYQACDLFCLPSQSETWGLAVNEAMAAGKAILVSDKVGCSEDLIYVNQNGNIFKSGNLTDLKSKLNDLVGNKIRLRCMGSQSKIIIQNWSFETQSNEILKFIYADK